MQQTQNYQLNLIETDDVFSPQALNENAEKLDAALSAKAGAAQADALDQRVTVLEARRMVVGSYAGNGTAFGHAQTFELGFTPMLLLIKRPGINSSLTQSTVISDVVGCDAHGDLLKIVPGGFWASRTINGSFNTSGETYYYFAVG